MIVQNKNHPQPWAEFAAKNTAPIAQIIEGVMQIIKMSVLCFFIMLFFVIG